MLRVVLNTPVISRPQLIYLVICAYQSNCLRLCFTAFLQLLFSSWESDSEADNLELTGTKKELINYLYIIIMGSLNALRCLHPVLDNLSNPVRVPSLWYLWLHKYTCTLTCTVNDIATKKQVACTDYTVCARNQQSFSCISVSFWLLWFGGKALDIAGWNIVYSAWIISVYQAPSCLK